MFAGLSYITLYWLSGFAENNYEIWESKKASINSTPTSLSFTAYLAWPQEVADDCQVSIRQTDTGLVFGTDWFPDEEFDAQVFDSRTDGSVMLMSKFQREVFFIHLRQTYD
jgi:hypothetical protein